MPMQTLDKWKAFHDEIGRLRAENESLRTMLRECADDLEAEVEGHYSGLKDHPAMKPKYDRDMDSVRRARTLLDSQVVAAGGHGQSPPEKTK